MLDLQSAVEDGKIEVDRITDRVNQGRKDFNRESSVYIGKVLRRLGFQLSRRHASKRRYYYDTELLDNLTTEYGLRDTPPHFASQPSPTSSQIQKNQIQGDIKDDGDAFSEDVHILLEATTEELLATQGWCLWQCSALDDEIIALVRDESVKGTPEGYVVYTMSEMAEIGRFRVPQSTLRIIHEAKKLASATVISVEPNHKEKPA